MTLGSFMAFWGWVFIGSTLWVATVRRDEHHKQPEGALREMVNAYREMLTVINLSSVRRLAIVLLTIKVATSRLFGIRVAAKQEYCMWRTLHRQQIPCHGSEAAQWRTRIIAALHCSGVVEHNH